MNKLILSILLISTTNYALASEPVQDLRGKYPVAGESVPPQEYKWQNTSSAEQRQYIQQPPVIPHKTADYTIDLKTNICLGCHSWPQYKKANAVKVSLTHFTNRDGIEQTDVAARRYVCTTCHVSQTDAKSLVENEFQPIDLLKK